MKTFVFLTLFAAAVATVQAAPQSEPAPEPALYGAIDALKLVIGSHLEQHIKAALAGHHGQKVVLDSVQIPRNLDGPALPSRVQINATLNDIYHYGIGDIVPAIDVDLLRLSLHANYKLPEFRLQGGYSIEIHSNFNPAEPDSREWLVLSGDSTSAASVRFTNLELDVQAKLKWSLFAGFSVDTLDYSIGQFGFDINFPNLRVMEGIIDVSGILNPLMTRMFEKELWDIENDWHQPLVDAIRDFIDWLLRGGLIG